MNKKTLVTIFTFLVLACIFALSNNFIDAKSYDDLIGIKTKKLFTGSTFIELSSQKTPIYKAVNNDIDVSDYAKIRIETKLVASEKNTIGVLLLKRSGCEDCIIESVSLSPNFRSQTLELPGDNIQITAAVYKFDLVSSPQPNPIPTPSPVKVELTIYGR
jgi:hypothetical protein